MPDSLHDFLKNVSPDEAARIWRWLAVYSTTAPLQMVQVLAAGHPHLYDLPKRGKA